jgi:DNA-binding GntR family transcriptional regulator
MAAHATERLKDDIENEIVTGRFLPGDRLDEVSLAVRYGVSRTPIREALHSLAASGLIEVRPHRGATVVDLGPDRLLEMFEVMAEMEAMCARLAARRMTEADHRELLAAHAACAVSEQAGDYDRYYYDNERFHLGIYASSHNGFLAEQARALHRRLQPYRRLQLRVRNRLATSHREHGQVIDAIAAGDGDLAADRLRAHVIVQGERFTDLVASLRSLKQQTG